MGLNKEEHTNHIQILKFLGKVCDALSLTIQKELWEWDERPRGNQNPPQNLRDGGQEGLICH